MRATGDPQLYLATVRHDSCLPWRQLKMIIGEGNTHSKGYSVPDAKRRVYMGASWDNAEEAIIL